MNKIACAILFLGLANVAALAQSTSGQGLGYASPTMTGVPIGTTGSCIASGFVGTRLAGTFSAAVCVAGTFILSGLPTAPNGYACTAQDRTTPANTVVQTASSVSSATYTATTTAADVVQFFCQGY